MFFGATSLDIMRTCPIKIAGQIQVRSSIAKICGQCISYHKQEGFLVGSDSSTESARLTIIVTACMSSLLALCLVGH